MARVVNLSLEFEVIHMLDEMVSLFGPSNISEVIGGLLPLFDCG